MVTGIARGLPFAKVQTCCEFPFAVVTILWDESSGAELGRAMERRGNASPRLPARLNNDPRLDTNTADDVACYP
jgi:hypothetical protein